MKIYTEEEIQLAIKKLKAYKEKQKQQQEADASDFAEKQKICKHQFEFHPYDDDGRNFHPIPTKAFFRCIKCTFTITVHEPDVAKFL